MRDNNERWGYPIPRPEARGDGAPATAPRYEQIQSSPETAATDTDAVVITFAGRPDAIDFSARLFPAVFTLQDDMGEEIGEVLVPINAVYSPQISANRVLVRNAIAGSNSSVLVVGKWATHRVERPATAATLAVSGP
jgi:hypothetical protein